MENNKNILCGANAYLKKFYFNEQYGNLPDAVKKELHIMCVLFTEDVGGVMTVLFNEEGKLYLEVSCEEDDYGYDDIGSEMKIRELQKTKAELFRSLELYYVSVQKGLKGKIL